MQIETLREQFRAGLIMNVGDDIQDNNGKYKIIYRGTNYVFAVNEEGILSKKFITAIKTINESGVKITTDVFYNNQLNESASDAEQYMVKHLIKEYKEGLITDGIAVLKLIKNLNKGDPITEQLSRLGKEDILNEMEKLRNIDRLKVAGIIATTLGGNSDGANPDTMVNLALQKAKLDGKFNNTSSLAIIRAMIEIAKSVGIVVVTNLTPPGTSKKLHECDMQLRPGDAVMAHHTLGCKCGTVTSITGDKVFIKTDSGKLFGADPKSVTKVSIHKDDSNHGVSGLGQE